MSQAEFLDATKEENFQQAFSKVQKIIVEDIEKTANAADDAKENIEDLESETVRLSKTIEDNLDRAVNSAINSLEKLPEAARVSATEFMANLTENLQCEIDSVQFSRKILENKMNKDIIKLRYLKNISVRLSQSLNLLANSSLKKSILNSKALNKN